MARPKGIPKTGGRQKGTPNKNRRALIELVRERAGVEPAEVLAKAMNNPEKAEWAAKELMPYCYPKITSIEHTAEESHQDSTSNKHLEKVKELFDRAARERKGKF